MYIYLCMFPHTMQIYIIYAYIYISTCHETSKNNNAYLFRGPFKALHLHQSGPKLWVPRPLWCHLSRRLSTSELWSKYGES